MNRNRIPLIGIPLLLVLLLAGAAALKGDGLIVIPRPTPLISTPYPLQVKNHNVKVSIKDQTAATYIDQVFYNPSGSRLEGYYLFPVPKGAVMNKFSMFVNGKEVQAELLDAKKARDIYEDIVRRQRDPALLEYNDYDVFKARIFPIEPYENKRVKISYNQILEKDNGTVEYIYPLNTEKFSPTPLNDVSVEVEIQSAEEIRNVYCPSHKAEIIQKTPKRVIVSYEDKNTKPDKDFKVYFQPDSKSKIGLSLLTCRKEGETGFFFLSASPGFSMKDEEISEKDITFVLDTSGSMAGEKMEQAKKALLFCVNNLNRGDRFEIVRFSTETEPLFGQLTPADPENINKASRFVKELKAIGGTAIEEALRQAISIKAKNSRPYMVIFITDGKPTIGETNEEEIVKIIKNANTEMIRIFTFGIGEEINTHLLDKLTELTRAYRTYISPEEDIEIKISNFYTKVQSPVMTDIRLKVEGVKTESVYPKNLPDLFKGSSLTALGQYTGSGKARIILEGKVRDKNQSFTFDVNFAKDDPDNDFIPPLWASRRIGFLLDQVRLHGQEKELVDEITQLARKYGIVTPYTSYLIIEEETDRVSRNEMPAENRTLGSALPATSDFFARSEDEYKSVKEKSGKKSVDASRAFQGLNQAETYDDMYQGKERLNYTDSRGDQKNLAQQVRNIQGKAFYNQGNAWIDPAVQEKKYRKNVRIRFGSDEYFGLLKKEPVSAQYLALGQNVKFVLNSVLYEIFE